MIAVIAFTVESQGIKLLALAACELTEASAEAVATFKAQILNPLERRIVKALNVFETPLGPFSTFHRGTFSFIMREVVLANAIDLLLTFSS